MLTAPAAPTFLREENPAHARFHEASDLFALFGYLKAQRFGVFSIRESLQAVGERSDGTLQGFHLSVDEAWECIQFMDGLGVGVVELPAFPANAAGQAFNAELLRRAAAAPLSIQFAAHARCVDIDVRAAVDSGFRRVHLYIGTSPIKQATAGATVEALADKAFGSIARARELGCHIVRISTEDAFRTTLPDYARFYTHLANQLNDANHMVDGIGIPDTVGLGTIDELGDRIAVLRDVGLQYTFLECHIHNDIGNADRLYVDTLLLCKRLGITMLPDFSILGIGERNGTIGLSSLLESIYRRLILLYPRKMAAIRADMRAALGALPDGGLFVNGYRDADAYFYRLLSRKGFVFDRSPFSANTEFDGSGVHADTTQRAYRLAEAEHGAGQHAVDLGNSAYSGALPPYDLPLRTPVLACFGCGKANVRFWRERAGLRLRRQAEVQSRIAALDDLRTTAPATEIGTEQADELVAQLIRAYSIRYNGITHQDAMDVLGLFYE